MTFWDIRNRPIDQPAEGCSLTGFGMDPSSEAH